MLLDDLLKPSVVQLGKFCQVMHIRNDITQILLQELEIILRWPLRSCAPSVPVQPARLILVQSANNLIDFSFAGFDSPHDFTRLHSLEGEDLVQFRLELGNEGLLVVFGPWPSFWMRIPWRWLGFVWSLKGVFQFIVEEIVEFMGLDQAGLELLAD